MRSLKELKNLINEYTQKFEWIFEGLDDLQLYAHEVFIGEMVTDSNNKEVMVESMEQLRNNPDYIAHNLYLWFSGGYLDKRRYTSIVIAELRWIAELYVCANLLVRDNYNADNAEKAIELLTQQLVIAYNLGYYRHEWFSDTIEIIHSIMLG